MVSDKRDRRILRELAKEVAEIAAGPVMADRKARWKEHNSLRSRQPMMLVYPEGAWEELLPASSLRCSAERERQIENALLMRIYAYRHFQDDTVVEAEWNVPAVIHDTGWGVEPHLVPSTTARGAFDIVPVIEDRRDLRKLRHPDIVFDEAATNENLQAAQDLFDGILAVRRRGRCHISYHLASQFMYLRGVTETLVDMTDAPEFVHEAMGLFTAGHRRMLGQLVDHNLLDLNNDNTYHGSGGNGYTEELPAPGFDAKRVRPGDLWASAESQEMAAVSPRMHEEFLMRYESQLLEPFGLTGYGCCEDLTRKLDPVLGLPHLRRVSISPFADVQACASRLGGRCILSWKPKPSHLVGAFDEARIRSYIKHALDAARRCGCVMEMVLKDTHTVEHHPERFDLWTRVAREEITSQGV